MDIHPVFVGIDVSKDRLDILDGRPSNCANAACALAPLARRGAEVGAFVVLEGTGAYDRQLRQTLDGAGVAYARVNPGKARDFARAAGFLVKTGWTRPALDGRAGGSRHGASRLASLDSPAAHRTRG